MVTFWNMPRSTSFWATKCLKGSLRVSVTTTTLMVLWFKKTRITGYFYYVTFFYLQCFIRFSTPNYDQIKFCYRKYYQLLCYACRIAFYFAMQFCNVSFMLLVRMLYICKRKTFFWLILRLWLYNEANAKVTNGLTTGKMVKRNCH